METVTDLHVIKQTIWRLCKKSLINLHIAADKAKVKIPYNGLTSVSDAEAILKVLTKPRRIAPPVPQWVKDRYNEAHRMWFQREYPTAYQDGQYVLPVFPKVSTGNGLNTFIENYIKWCGFRATRINVTGRMIAGKRIKSSTRKGSADVSSTIQGSSVMWETKVGNDRPSPAQLKEQAREIAAGGQYFFVKTPETFLHIYDSLIYG